MPGVELPGIETLVVPDSESEPASPVPVIQNPVHSLGTGKTKKQQRRKLVFDGVAVPLPPWKTNRRQAKTTAKEKAPISIDTNSADSIVNALQSTLQANDSEKIAVDASTSATPTGEESVANKSGSGRYKSVVKKRVGRPALRRSRGSYAAPTRSSRQSQTTSAAQSEAEFAEPSPPLLPAHRPVRALKPISYDAAQEYVDAALETNVGSVYMPPPPPPPRWTAHWRDDEDDRMSVYSNSSASWPTARDEQLAQQSEQWCLRVPPKFLRSLQRQEPQSVERPRVVTSQSRKSLFDEHIKAIKALGCKLTSEEAMTESDQGDLQPGSSSVQTDASELVEYSRDGNQPYEDAGHPFLIDTQAEASEANASSTNNI
ncbi:hypothetical protein CONPUDRAFT_72485 [Coniophora puteana RWD-64-598 SS2]|uniref:Uncharacterized protein n=1 Tax=Coniophora puteana (strain RWD-64-598) TaxID=741705 RepID=A0A5M3MSP0_CONPW|nr:uncharacterized protein CONPUDRAFT_72485 [Coniophora puteana RWD-64-598 SS2]EIW82182.1 hypothetical protein CONPUDRAFT_72485 [Coniophora puteana RWD-64-598 SS2]